MSAPSTSTRRSRRVAPPSPPPAATTICHTSDPQWLDERGKLITASDMATVLGLNPYRTPSQLYLEKTGQSEQFSGNEATEWGQLLEPVVLAEFGRRTGRRVRRDGWLYRSNDYPMIGCTLDGRQVVDRKRGLVEIKTAGARASGQWDDGVPVGYQIQVQCQLLVTGYTFASIACLLAGQRLVWCDIERDEDMISRIISEATAFWTCVETNTPPPPDSARGVEDVLAQTEPGKVALLPIEACAWDDEIAELADTVKSLGSRKQELINRIARAMGDAEIGSLPGGGQWKWTQGRSGRYLRRGGKS